MKVSRRDIEEAYDRALEDGQLEWTEDLLKDINKKYDKQRYSKRQSRGERIRRTAVRDENYPESDV